MKKILKKTLSIVLTLLMIVTMIPFTPVAFAAESDGTPTTVTLKESDTEVAIGSATDCDPDGYIITGSAPNAVIKVSLDDVKITLDNVTASYIQFYGGDDSTAEILLKGNNSLKDEARYSSLTVYKTDVVIKAEEGATLTAESAGPFASAGGNGGTLTINGGTIKGSTVTTGNSPTLGCAFTLNGGEVTLSNNYYYTLFDKVTLNGGTLKVINTSSDREAVNCDVTMKKGANLIVNSTGGILYDNDVNDFYISEAESANSSYFVRTDSTSDFAPTYDIKSAVKNATYAEIKVDAHSHVYANGVCACGLECEHDTDSGECSLCGKYFYTITHQPTVAEPYVELNNSTNAKYQWYTVECEEITDKNATGGWSYFGAPSEVYGTYNSETGWSASDNSYGSYYFVVELEEGQIVEFKFSDEVTTLKYMAGIEGGGVAVQGTECSFTAGFDGTYGFYIGEFDVTLKAYIGGLEYTAVDGQTSATLANPAYGNKYVCEVTYGDGTTEKTAVVDYSYKITHQPTAAEPYVELNDDTDASYQWYTVELEKTELTDENAEAYSYDGKTAFYDSQTGWTPVLDEDGYYSSATIELKKGDTVTVVFEESGFSYLGFWDYEIEHEGAWANEESGVTTYELTVDTDGTYTFYTKYSVNHKVYLDEAVYSKVDGQTSATLANPAYGNKYACKVTFKDDTTETSDVVDYSYKITHQPTAAEPYVELNDNTDATYQWYTVERGEEITDENAADATSYDDEEFVYTADTGWEGIPYDNYGGYDFFAVELEEGEKITVAVNGKFTDDIGIWDYEEYDGVRCYSNSENIYTFTAPYSATYWLYMDGAEDDVTVRAYFGEITYTKVDGQTAATLTPSELGNYACKVTFKDGTTETSETVEITTLHTHSGGTQTCKGYKCECGEWYGAADANAHDYDRTKSEANLTRPTETAKGYYTYSCKICDGTTTEEVETADYTAYNEAKATLTALLAREDLCSGPKNGYTNALNGITSSAEARIYIESEQQAVDNYTSSLNSIIAQINAGLAEGTIKKADFTYITSLFDEINALIDNNPGNIVPSMNGYYYGPEGFYNYNVNNPDFSQSQYDGTMERYDYETKLEDLLVGLKDGTMLKADYTEIDAAIAEIDEALASATISDEMKAELEDIKADLAELKVNQNISKADLANSGLVERAEAITQTMADCANGVHSFTTYTEVTAPECGKTGLEKASCDNGCGATDERDIAVIDHNWGEYKSNGDATCTADGTKTAECVFGCGAEDTVTDEDTMLDHVDEDGNKVCDECGGEIIDTCPDCGRPIHEGLIYNIFCLIYQFIRLIKSVVAAVK